MGIFLIRAIEDFQRKTNRGQKANFVDSVNMVYSRGAQILRGERRSLFNNNNG